MQLGILKKKIDKTCKISFYIEYKNELIQKIESNKISQDIKDEIQFIIDLLDSPENLLIQDQDIKYQFLKSPNENHQIFTSVNLLLDKINQIKNKFQLPSSIKLVLENIINCYEESKQIIVNKAIQEDSFEIFKQQINLVRDDLMFYDIPLRDTYRTISYSMDALNFVKQNEDGSSYVTIVNGICNKIDAGSNLLRPLKEYAVYQLYCGLFGEDQEIISPTTLLLFCNVPILDNRSDQSIRFQCIKRMLDLSSNSQLYLYKPKEKETLLNSFQLKHVTPVQANLFQEGISFQYVVDQLNEDNQLLNQLSNNNNFMYSLSAHILSSLLLNYSDSKSDNYIYDEKRNLIIGVDNDECLEYLDFQRLNGRLIIKFKNIFFNLNKLMSLPVNKVVREEFINCNPFGIILEWLLKMYDQENILISQINKSVNSNPYILEKQKIVGNLMNELQLPHKFPQDWVNKMLDRFITINKCLNENIQITHLDIFKKVYPLAYFYHISTLKLPTPLARSFATYTDDNDIEKYIKNAPDPSVYQKHIENTNYEKPTQHLTIKETIKSIVESLTITNLINCDNKSTFNKVLKLLLNLSRNKIIDRETCQFHSSWKLLIDKWILVLIENSLEEEDVSSLLIDVFQLFNIKESDLNNNSLELPILYSIIHNIRNQELKSNVIIVINTLNKYGCDLDKTHQGESPLDLASEYRDKEIIQTLIGLGAGEKLNSNIFNDYYQRLTINEKQELESTISLLNRINQKTNWILSFNHLFKILPIPNKYPPLLKLITFNGKTIEERILISNINDQNIINDGIHNIKIKKNPKFPSYHVLFNQLYGILFKEQTLNCEIGILDGKPVLLTEYKFFKSFSEYLSTPTRKPINHSSFSKLIIMLLLFQKFEDNPNSFALDFDNRIYSTENDDCFLPLKNNFNNNIFKIRDTNLQLFLVDQIHESVDREVVSTILNLDVEQVLKEFVKEVKTIQMCMNELFFIDPSQSTSDFDYSKSFVGVLFYKNQFKKLYIRLSNLQKQFKSNKDVTLIQLVNLFLGKQKSDKPYSLLKDLSYKEIMLHHKIDLCTNENNAVDEYESIYGNIRKIEAIICDLNSSISTTTRQCRFNNLKPWEIEFFLKYLKIEEISKTKELYTIDLLFKNQYCSVSYLSLKNFKFLESIHLNLPCLSHIRVLNLSNCPNLRDFSPKSYLFSIEMSVLEKLTLNNCTNLISVSIIAPQLRYFSASGCIKFLELSLDSSTLLETLILSNGTLRDTSNDFNLNNSNNSIYNGGSGELFRSKLTNNRDKYKLKILFNNLLKFSSFQLLSQLDISNNYMDFVEQIDIVNFIVKFQANNTTVLYDKCFELYKINCYEYFNNLDIKKEIDINIKTLTGYSKSFNEKIQIQNDRKNSINKVFKYLNGFVHVSYNILNQNQLKIINNNSSNYSNNKPNITIGLLVINPLNFDYQLVKNSFNKLNNDQILHYVYGVTKSNLNGYSTPDGADLFNQDKSLKLLRADESIPKKLWFNICSLADEERVKNELFNSLFN